MTSLIVLRRDTFDPATLNLHEPYMPTLSSKLKKIKPTWIALAVLFPLWGIGGVQLLAQAVHELPDLAYTPYNQFFVNPIVAFVLSLSWLGAGIGLTLRAACAHQTARIPKLDEMIRDAKARADRAAGIDEGELDYDSHQERVSKEPSYARLWYMSFQNHLRAVSGFDTMQLTPLKQWPAILKSQMNEDIVPVWNLPLLLICIASIPVIAMFIAAADVLVSGFTGVSVCGMCLQLANAISLAVAVAVYSFPAVVALVVVAGVAWLVVPLISAYLLKVQVQYKDLQAAASEMILDSVVSDGLGTVSGMSSGVAPVPATSQSAANQSES